MYIRVSSRRTGPSSPERSVPAMTHEGYPCGVIPTDAGTKSLISRLTEALTEADGDVKTRVHWKTLEQQTVDMDG